MTDDRLLENMYRNTYVDLLELYRMLSEVFSDSQNIILTFYQHTASLRWRRSQQFRLSVTENALFTHHTNLTDGANSTADEHGSINQSIGTHRCIVPLRNLFKQVRAEQ